MQAQLKYYVVNDQLRITPEKLVACTDADEVHQVIYDGSWQETTAWRDVLSETAEYVYAALRRGFALAWVWTAILLLIGALAWWAPYALKIHPGYVVVTPLLLSALCALQAGQLAIKYRRIKSLVARLLSQPVQIGPYVPPPSHMHAAREKAKMPSIPAVVAAIALCGALIVTVCRTAYPLQGYYAVITDAEGYERAAVVEQPTAIPLGHRWQLVPKQVTGYELGYIYYDEVVKKVAVARLDYRIDNTDATPPKAIRQVMHTVASNLGNTINRVRAGEIEGDTLALMAAPLPPDEEATIEGYIRQAVADRIGGRPRRIDLSVTVVSLGAYQEYLQSK